ncbi:hypothetical protein PHJA_002226800 [Phtheirospermum japonicum]|uniref:Uncharacterized protein n=1 Tax=Phtheirospermum japonicum TaxID=374723 RepID=A0A830CT64_9LAMI|nr:hypothetical protein PHJA_002226800 [Phtheirospermum japonicum]
MLWTFEGRSRSWQPLGQRIEGSNALINLFSQDQALYELPRDRVGHKFQRTQGRRRPNRGKLKARIRIFFKYFNLYRRRELRRWPNNMNTVKQFMEATFECSRLSTDYSHNSSI